MGMMTMFYMKQNDTSPSIAADLSDSSNVPINLTDATVRFNMRDQAGNVLINNQDAVVTDAQNGSVRYDWQVGDTSMYGTHYAEFEVTYDNGTIETFPNNTNIQVKILQEIA